MIRGNKLHTTAKIAVCAALLGSSPALFAQDVVPAPAAQPTPPVVVTPPPVVQTAPEPTATVAPPPAVRTVPDSSLGQPIASEPTPRAAAERPVARRTPARPTATPRAAEAAPVATAPAEPEVAIDTAPISEPTTLGDAAAEETATAAPVEQTAPTEIADGTQDDWMIYGGLAAALGLAGLGGVVASRRRRSRQNDYRPVESTVPVPMKDYTAPRPMVSEQPAPRIIQPRVVDTNLPPVTDPLFAHQAELPPVTDPLFSQKVELPPVTDPMFANKDDYEGASNAGAAFDKRRTWPAVPAPREMEPAE